ncbi:MAG: DUF4932 domain-containing protein [Caldisericia bacterium]|nr:DUF4932 domain-containing protein [Caldisericia bacterium]
MQNKHFFKVVLCILVIMLFSSFLSTSSYALQSSSLSPQSTKKQVVVSTDPRIELIATLQMMIGAWPMSSLDFDYIREVQDTFYPYYRHPVLQQFAYMWYMYGFSQEIPSTCMLHLSQPPELKVQIPFSKEIIDCAGGERNLNDFLTLLRDFAETTDFMYFYEDHLGFYQDAIQLAEKKLETKNTIFMLEDYFGYTNRSYELILVPLFHEDGYATNVNLKYYALIGPFDVDEKKDEKLPYWKDSDGLHKQLLKSFSYAFVHPLIRSNHQKIIDTQKLLIPIRRPMMYVDIQTWPQCLTEHIVRTISQRFTFIEYGEKDWKEQRQKDIQDSFVYIDYIEKWLQDYETNRSFYADFERFYPVLFNNVRTLCEYPFIPTELTVLNASENGVQLSWKNNAIEPCKVYILRKTKMDEFMVLHEMEDSQAFAWTDSSIERDTQYLYVIAVKGEKGEIRSIGVSTAIPISPPLAPVSISYSLEDSSIVFSFEYPFKAEGFTLFEWTGEESVEITSLDRTEEDLQTISVNDVSTGTHTYYICSYITVLNDEQEEEMVYSPPSSFLPITIP